MKNLSQRILALTIFSIAMGLLEAAVVVYLRELYYPMGFSFPLIPIDKPLIAITEMLREAATLVMLVGVGYLFGQNFIQRFAGFLLSFAIWDIFYYVFLKILLNWPESFFTWDVLFLLPVTWAGPVLAPIIISLTMIYYAYIFLKTDYAFPKSRLSLKHWIILLIPTSIVFLSFIWDPMIYLIEQFGFISIFSLTEEKLLSGLSTYIPTHFNWPLFIIGEIGLLIFILCYHRFKIKNFKIN